MGGVAVGGGQSVVDRLDFLGGFSEEEGCQLSSPDYALHPAGLNKEMC